MRIFILLLAIVSSELAFSANDQCIGGKNSTLKVLGSGPYSYEILNSGYLFRIDGLKDKFNGSVDKEAIKRLFVNCSPIVASCLKQKSVKLDSGAIEISFKINQEQHHKPQSITLTSTLLHEKVKKCLVEKWSMLEMPEASSEVVVGFTLEFKSFSK